LVIKVLIDHPLPFRSAFNTSVINMWPGAWVITSGSLLYMIAFCGVTPQGQKTGSSPSLIVTGSP